MDARKLGWGKNPLYRYRKFQPNQYDIVVIDEAGRPCVQIYLLNEVLRKKFRTPMLFSYDSKMWIKSAGGRSVRFEELKEALGLDEETVRHIEAILQVKSSA